MWLIIRLFSCWFYICKNLQLKSDKYSLFTHAKITHMECFNRCGNKRKGKQLFCAECQDKPRPKINGHATATIYDKM